MVMKIINDISYEDKLVLWSFVLFFCNNPVQKSVSFVFGWLGDNACIFISCLIVYSPLLLVLIRRVKTNRVFSGFGFLLLYFGIVLLMLVTLCFHPEYSEKMFDENWNYNILTSLFSPLCGIFAFLIISVASKDSL